MTWFDGTPDDVKVDVRRALADGYAMIEPGCSIPPAAVTENLRAMVGAVEEAAGYRRGRALGPSALGIPPRVATSREPIDSGRAKAQGGDRPG